MTECYRQQAFRVRRKILHEKYFWADFQEADQVIDKAVILEKTVQLLQRNRSNFSQLQGESC